MRVRFVNPLVVRAESKVKSKAGFRANAASFVDHESKLAPLRPSPALASPRKPSSAFASFASPHFPPLRHLHLHSMV